VGRGARASQERVVLTARGCRPHRPRLRVRPELLREDITPAERESIYRRSRAGVLPYVLAAALAAVSPYLTLAICAAIAVYYALPSSHRAGGEEEEPGGMAA